MDKLVFIIAHKYFRGYESYLKYYINNIKLLYPNYLILIVDNNSENKEDVYNTIEKDDNIIYLTNNIECKFELGAYIVGMKYLIDNNLSDYDYYIFTQDTYILKNKYDFNILKNNNINATSIIGWDNDWEKMDVVQPILTRLGLFNRFNEVNLCWCNSFVISNKVIFKLYEYINDIVITVRHQSEGSERYLGRILYELNDSKNYAIDGAVNNYVINDVIYDCHSINPYDKIDKYFCKIAQQKNERTK
jgi:hypothetical protein